MPSGVPSWRLLFPLCHLDNSLFERLNDRASCLEFIHVPSIERSEERLNMRETGRKEKEGGERGCDRGWIENACQWIRLKTGWNMSRTEQYKLQMKQ